ncbi:hypothetical protein ACVNIS_11380 [Sphaerotilaceae bacterium SBD11-9]
MKHQHILQRLVDNAFDFLDRALGDLETAPKYSVIHFYAAIELFLKARLLAEHWSLVITKRQDADLNKFLQGDFQSVTLEEAAERIEKVLQSPLSQAELQLFKGIGKHRNRMVHFFHDGDGENPKEELKQKVVAEQLRAWYLLNRLLSDRWKDVFSPWKDKLMRVSLALKQNRRYLGAVYELVQPQIRDKRAKSILFNDCPSCGYLAAEVQQVVGKVHVQHCVVCELPSSQVLVPCLDCSEPVLFVDEGFAECDACGQRFEPHHLRERLDEDERGTKDYFESGMPGHCTLCSAYKTVVHHGGKCVCASCLTVFDDYELRQCGYCGDVNAGELESSSTLGCVACEGSAGNSRDD